MLVGVKLVLKSLQNYYKPYKYSIKDSTETVTNKGIIGFSNTHFEEWWFKTF